MELGNLVAHYATKGEKGVEINLEALSQDKHFRSQAVQAVVKKVKENPHACVFFPSYKPACDHNPLGKLINEVALSLQVETLVTGNYEKLKDLQNPVKDVIIVKQSFRSGKELRAQIEELKAMGYDVSVLCLIAHSGAKVEAFAHENGRNLLYLTPTLIVALKPKTRKDRHCRSFFVGLFALCFKSCIVQVFMSIGEKDSLPKLSVRVLRVRYGAGCKASLLCVWLRPCLHCLFHVFSSAPKLSGQQGAPASFFRRK